MVTRNAYDTYRTSKYEGMDPKRLTLLLYERVLQDLDRVKEGIEENDVKKRGENLSHAIAIITELYASLDSRYKDDSTEFLRGLYESMLLELSKVSITNDIKTIDLSISYLSGLKDIWKKNVLKDNGKKIMQKDYSNKNQKPSSSKPHANVYNGSNKYGEQQSIPAGIRSFSV